MIKRIWNKIRGLSSFDKAMLALIICVTVILKLFIINYGFPYLYKYDEVYILKDPFKLLYAYAQLDFSQSTNLYFWLLSFWWGCVFAIGKLLGNWESLEAFRTLLVAENYQLVFWGRVSSLILVVAGNLLMYRVARLFLFNRISLLLTGLAIVFNPMLFFTGNWLKFDAICYAMLAIVMYQLCTYFILEQRDNKRKTLLYFWLFAAVATRIDFAAIALGAFIADWWTVHSRSIPGYLKGTWKRLAIYTLLYSVVTLGPISFLFNKLASGSSQYGAARSFEEAITDKLFINPVSEGLWANLGSNIYIYFLEYGTLIMGPIAMLVFAWGMIKRFSRIRVLVGTLALYFIPLMMFPASGMRYFIFPSIFFLVGFMVLSAQFSNKLRNGLLTIMLVWFATFVFEGLYCITTITDPKTEAREYLLQNSTVSDTLAFNDFLILGNYPPINECPDVLRHKAEVTRQFEMGSGETLDAQAQLTEGQECRTIIEVYNLNRFEGTPMADVWVNTYDPQLLEIQNPLYYTSDALLTGHEEFDTYIHEHFELVKSFELDFFDPRMDHLYKGDAYLGAMHIWKRKPIRP